jgi:hypothetical protein
VDPDAAGAEFPSVEHQVVGLGTDTQERLGVAVEEGQVLVVRHRERVVRRHGPTGRIVDVLEERKVDDPEEPQPALVGRGPTELETQEPEDVGRAQPLVRDQVEHVAHLGTEPLGDTGEFRGRHELGDRRHQCRGAVVPGLDPHPDQTLGPPALAGRGQVVETAPAGRLRGPGVADALDRAGPERLELRLGEQVGELDELHPEPDVRLVGAEPVDRLTPGDPGHLAHALAPHGPDGGVDGGGDHLEDVLLAGEAHLGVELGELELPVRSQVLVAEAPRHLVVAVDTAHHAQLLEELRALGQGVEGTRPLA